jgi:sterol desaturase/sphingolipid hydroxylase (fatty acid hydroxylase superfamily)
MYSIARNPLYLGNFLMVLGVVIFLRVWWIPLIYVLLFALYYERIIFAEEMFLRRKFGKEYIEWAAKTPAFFPRLRLWKAPSPPFDWRKVFRREYHGMIAVVVGMFVLEVVSDVYSGHGFAIDTIWRTVLSVAFATYLVVRFVHKHTSFLQSNRGQSSHVMS